MWIIRGGWCVVVTANQGVKNLHTNQPPTTLSSMSGTPGRFILDVKALTPYTLYLPLCPWKNQDYVYIDIEQVNSG
jgi:hypothetical protein